MTTVLKIDSSIYSQAGQSSQLASQFIAALREREPDARVVERDLAREPVPHLDAARFQAFLTKPEDLAGPVAGAYFGRGIRWLRASRREGP